MLDVAHRHNDESKEDSIIRTAHLIALAAALLWALPVLGAETLPGDTLDLRAVLVEGLAANPEIAAARDEWRAAEARIPAAGALDDPMLELMLDEQPIRGDGAGERDILLSQGIPFPGKRRLMTSQARREGDATRERARDTIRRVITEVKIAYWDLYLLDNQLAVMRESRSALDDVVQSTRARYEAGIGGQQDHLLARVEAAELDGELLHTEALGGAARAKLNLLMNRNAASPLGRPHADSLSPFDATLDSLLAAARAERPSVRALEEEVAAAESELRLARTAYRPDLTLSGGYMQIPDAVDEWRAAIGLAIPIWKGRKQNALALAAARRLDAARADLAAERNRVGSRVEEEYAHVASERSIARLYEREILPHAELAYRSALANYLAGREAFLVLLESLRKRIDLTKTYYEYFVDSEMHLARLEEAVGRDLGGIRLDLDAALEADSESNRTQEKEK